MSASLSRLQSFYSDLNARLLLHAMIKEEFTRSIALLTSFGADAGLMLALVAEVDPVTPVLFLDTGKHFPETLDYGRMLQKHFGLTQVHWLKPDPVLLDNNDREGTLWSAQPNRCCWLRKVEPLNRALETMGILALITGRKRYQTSERSGMEKIELDENSVFRINPLAYWSKEEQAKEMQKRAIPPHPLVEKGYKSVGCAPCTLPVGEGQDERAGRWAHTVGIEDEQKAECGIHIPAAATTWSV
jgi:phosphoadenosine phosphosulfate reductase